MSSSSHALCDFSTVRVITLAAGLFSELDVGSSVKSETWLKLCLGDLVEEARPKSSQGTLVALVFTTLGRQDSSL